MSSEISQFGDFFELAFRRDVPWHGLGQNVEENDSLDAMVKKAHMEWHVLRKPISMQIDNHTVQPGMDILYRNDNYFPLSVVPPSYEIVQPRDIFDFYRSLIDSAGYSMDVIGALHQGKKVWALAKTSTFEVVEGDKVDCYLLLATSYDGSLATTAKFTTIRVVCQNTLNMALRDKQSVKVRHSTKFNPEQVVDKLIEQNDWISQTKALVNLRISNNLAKEILSECMQKKDIEESPQYRKIMDLFMKSGTMIERETGWGFLNAVTEYCDWYSKEKKNQNTRLEGMWFKESLKDKIYETLVSV